MELGTETVAAAAEWFGGGGGKADGWPDGRGGREEGDEEEKERGMESQRRCGLNSKGGVRIEVEVRSEGERNGERESRRNGMVTVRMERKAEKTTDGRGIRTMDVGAKEEKSTERASTSRRTRRGRSGSGRAQRQTDGLRDRQTLCLFWPRSWKPVFLLCLFVL